MTQLMMMAAAGIESCAWDYLSDIIYSRVLSTPHKHNPDHRSPCLVHTSIHPQLSSPLRISGTARTHNARLLFPPLRYSHPPHTPRHLRISDPQHLRVCISMIPIGIPLPVPVDHLGTAGCHPPLFFPPHPHRTPEDDPLAGAFGHGNPPPHGPARLPSFRSTPS